MDDPAAYYNRLAQADPAALLEQARWLEDKMYRAGVTFDGRAMRTCLRPQLVGAAEWESLRRAGLRLMEVAVRVARTAFGGDVDALCDFLGTPDAERRWVRVDPGPPDVVLSRLDAFLGPDGPRFIEINSDAPAGFGYGDRMAEVFADLPLLRAFASTHPVRYTPSGPALVEAVLAAGRSARPSGPSPVVAIVDWSEVKTRADQEILRARFEAHGVRCLLADPRSMSVGQGRLWAAGTAVDVVYRRAVLGEVVERESDVGAFLAAYRDGMAVFVNSFRCHLSEDKAFFAILTDEAFASLMTAEEAEMVRRVVPWTRRVAERRTVHGGREVDLVPYVVEHRASLVLKPAHGYGGRSVLVGDETSPEAWSAAVQAGLREPWVVQERVAIPEEVFPVLEGGEVVFASLKVNTNPFYAGGAEVGAVARASRSSVINVSAGGGSVPTFVVG
ncbi:MAG TPA: hypothetical protein VMR21_08865 [Vicinamibacteria bacterium]|nr:hypothetical protein [Vicinamibacteria bacterium]